MLPLVQLTIFAGNIIVVTDHVISVADGLDSEPPTDESGDVDLALLELCMSLSVTARAERHYHARLMAGQMRRLARDRYGPIIDDLEAVE